MTRALTKLSRVKSAIGNRDDAALADSLAELISVEPGRWTRLLLIDGGLKDPMHVEFGAQLRVLAAAFERLIKSDQLPLRARDGVAQLLLASMTVADLFDSLRPVLEAAEFFADDWDVQQHRLLAFLESQWLLGLKKLSTLAVGDSDRFDTRQTYAAHFDTEAGNVVGLGDVIEGLVDAIELLVRYAQRSRAHIGSTSDAVRKIRSPYLDPDLELALRLAAGWHAYEDAWTRFKYLSWRLTTVPEEDGVLLLHPPDREAFLRSEAGLLRDGQFSMEFWAGASQAIGGVDNARAARQQLANSLIVPAIGVAWDGFLDFDALENAVAASHEGDIAQLWVDLMLYTSSAERLRIGDDTAKVTWEQWLAVAATLREVARALELKRQDTRPDDDDDDGLGCVLTVDRDVLANLVSTVVPYSREDCRRVIDVMVFDARRQHLEIYDQPLLPVQGKNLVLFSPCLLRLGNPSRAIEHFLSQWGDTSKEERGTTFEDVVATGFSRCLRATQCSRVKFRAADGKEVEYDLLVWWDDVLLIVECKSIRGVHSPAELWRASNGIDEAVAQLERRKKIVQAEWAKIRTLAPTLELPELPVPRESIVCLVVTTTSQFTGPRADSLFIVDRRCLERFFGDQDILEYELESDGTTKDIGAISSVRKSADFHADELLGYLRAPPQVTMIRDRLKTTLRQLPTVTGTQECVWVVDSEFVPAR